MAENLKFPQMCCNPFKKTSHDVRYKLRKVTKSMLSSEYEMKEGMKICNTCRAKLNIKSGAKKRTQKNDPKESSEEPCQKKKKVENDPPHEGSFNDSMLEPGPSRACNDNLDSDYINVNDGIEHLSATLSSLGGTPINKRKIKSSNKYKNEKKRKVIKTLGKTLFKDTTDDDPIDSEIVEQLQGVFANFTRSEQYQILTTMPKSWSIRKLERAFNVSYHMARRAKDLFEKKGAFSSPDQKPGRTLDPETEELATNFYFDEEVSRQMPGIRDCISLVGADGQRRPVQKRLVLGNLREIFKLFKSKYPSFKIGFSKFASLRPENCVLAGASGTHSVCVCTYHQNVKMMISDGKLDKITLPKSDMPLLKYQHYIAQIMCNPPTQKCFLKECEYCPKVDDFSQKLLTGLEQEMIQRITYNRWTSNDRGCFETITEDVSTFVTNFTDKLVVLRRHDFIAKQQSAFFAQLKESLKIGEAIVTCDFAENYAFILQDAAQNWHWNNSQATVHPVVVYYKILNEKGEEVLKHKSFVFISDCLTHNTILFYAFQKKLLSFLKEFLPNVRKLYYFSDGCAGQYKNRKNFINLCYHSEDYGIPAEWHFYATAHGKGACNGIGGTLKRNARKASLQKVGSSKILTARELFDWGELNLPSVTFFFTDHEEYRQAEIFLTERLQKAIPVVGTQRFHAFIPIDQNSLHTKVYSRSEETLKHRIQINDADNITHSKFEDFYGFVACIYDNCWWIGCVLSKDEVERELEISFLHPSGPATSFSYPRRPDVLPMPEISILCRVDPVTATGRSYSLKSEEIKRVASIFETKQRLLHS